MSAVLIRPLLRRDEPTLGSRVPWLAGVVAAMWALIAGAALSALPALVHWISGGAADPISVPAKTAATVWLAAHRVPLAMEGGGTLQLAPGGLAILIVLLLYRAGRWTAHVTAAAEPAVVARILLPSVAGYAGAAAIAARFAEAGQLSAPPGWSAVWCGAVAGAAMGAGVLREAPRRAGLTSAIPPWARTAVFAGVGIVLALLVVGAVLAAATVGLHGSSVSAGLTALQPDEAGLVVLAGLNMALALNTVVWSAAYALGPGFALGTGTVVSPAAIEVGPLPALPLLGALPADPGGVFGWIVLAGPVGAGLVGGAFVWRRTSGSPRLHQAGIALTAAAAAAVMMSALALLSGGSAGADRLAEVGPVPWQVAAATLILTGPPAALVAGLMDGIPRRALLGRDEAADEAAATDEQATDEPAPDEPVPAS